MYECKKRTCTQTNGCTRVSSMRVSSLAKQLFYQRITLKHVCLYMCRSLLAPAPKPVKPSWGALRKDFIHEMGILFKLRHPNLLNVMGAVITEKNEPLLGSYIHTYTGIQDTIDA